MKGMFMRNVECLLRSLCLLGRYVAMDGKPVRLGPDIPHQRHVFLVPLVVIVRDIGIVAILDLCAYVSQMDAPRPSSFTVPSI
jgi:hypothetical protein